MSQYQFGAGYVLGKRVDTSLTQPAFFGVVQEWNFDIDQKLVKLMGQYKDPVDVAPGERDITGKIKFARLQATMFGNMLLGVNPTAASGIDLIGPELRTAAATVTVTSGSVFVTDLGVYYNLTGIALQPVAAAPALGQYIAGVAGVGTYSFNASETLQVNFFYSVTATDQYKITLGSALMGTGPVVQLNFSVPYTVQNAVKKFNVSFPAVRMGKTPMAFKNANYLIPEMEFTAFGDSSGNVFTWSMTE